MRILKKTILSALILLMSSSLWADVESDVYSFGVVPQQSAKRLAKIWTPVLKYISKSSGIKLRFKTAKNIPEFEKRLAAGDYDFAYMNPYHFTVFNRDPGYTAVAVRKDQPIRGIIVVRKDSPLNTLADLANQKLAFPSPAAFAASVLPRAELTKQGIDFSSKYVSSHDSVYLNVAKGLLPAGGGVKRTFNNTKPEVREQLRVLWTSEAYTPHAIAAHPKVSADIHQAIQTAFVKMTSEPEGKKLLQSLKIKNGLVSASNADWDDVRGLGIDLLDRLIKE